jgi:DNA polymerase-3 subunit alpha
MIEGMSNRGRGNLDGQLDMFSAIPSDDVMRKSTAFEYPMIAEFSTRELLMQEKEASGMYFSGHLLDSYSKNIADLDVTPLSEFALDESGDSKFSDRQRVKVAGVISAVTAKTTKKEERMAFFTLEDKFSSIGCIAFPQQYARVSQNIHIDSAVVIEGSVTFRDEDEIQIVVSSVAPLVENSSYVPAEKPATAEKKETPAAAEKAEKPKRLFLRVPDRESTEFMKAVNLIDIFDGYTQVVFYQMDEKTYFTYSSGIALSDFVMGELKEILGDSNVIYK